MFRLTVFIVVSTCLLAQQSVRDDSPLGVCDVLSNPQKYTRRLVRVRGSYACNDHQCVLFDRNCKLFDSSFNYTWPPTLPVLEPDDRLLHPLASFVQSQGDKERRQIDVRSFGELAKGYEIEIDEMEILGEIQAPREYRRLFGSSGDPAGVGDQGRSKALIVVKQVVYMRIRASAKP